MVAVLELDEGTAALPAGVLRELGFGGGGGVALVHGGSGLGPAGCLSYSRLARRTREFGVDGGKLLKIGEKDRKCSCDQIPGLARA
jgi:hypothetical protein